MWRYLGYAFPSGGCLTAVVQNNMAATGTKSVLFVCLGKASFNIKEARVIQKESDVADIEISCI